MALSRLSHPALLLIASLPIALGCRSSLDEALTAQQDDGIGAGGSGGSPGDAVDDDSTPDDDAVVNDDDSAADDDAVASDDDNAVDDDAVVSDDDAAADDDAVGSDDHTVESDDDSAADDDAVVSDDDSAADDDAVSDDDATDDDVSADDDVLGDDDGVAVAACGDAVIGPGEVCDDAINDGSYGTCNPDCSLAAHCGDGVTDEAEEECDDGNDVERDGCSADCRLWFDTAFTRRTRLDLANPSGEAQASFPLLVTLDASSIDWAELGDAGVCFVAADGTTVLPYEAELWSPGNPSLVWVRLPEFAAAGEEAWLYYGNVTNDRGCSSADGVWRDSFRGVWHMNGSTDSSMYAHPMMDTGSTDVAGAVGRARGITRSGRLVGPSDPLLHITGDLTVSAWVSLSELATASYSNGIVTYGDPAFSAETNYAYGFYVTGTTALFSYWAYGDSQTVNVTGATTSMGLNELHHLAMVRDADASVVRFYYDGVQRGADVPYAALPDGGELGHLVLGGNVYSDPYSMVGVLDEVRISAEAVSDAWIQLEHASMTGALVSPVMDP